LISARLHPLTLCFRDNEIERGFLDNDFHRSTTQIRTANITGIFCFFTLGWFFDDWLFPSETHQLMWNIRMVAEAVPFIVILISYHPIFRRLNYISMSLGGLSGGLGIIMMSQYLSKDMMAYYYPALIIITFFTYNLSGTRFIYALGVDFILFATFNIALFYRGESWTNNFILYDFNILASNLIGGGAGYLTELQRRKLFISELNARSESENSRKAKQEADAANIEKSRFLAAVSHDLRQPIHAQGLFLNMLSETDISAEQTKIVSNIQIASAAMGDMLHTLMDFSRIEAGVMSANIQNFSIQPLLNKIENEFLSQADVKNLVYRSRETSLSVRSDPAMLEMILRNLISNAIHYTESGGIMVACRKRGRFCALEVYDTGMGIESAHHGDIFREFYQVNNPERDRRKGLGLGLFIVKGLSHTLEHALVFKSIPGRGTMFRLMLPMAELSEHQAEIQSLDFCSSKTGLRILFVDDDELVRIGTQQQLIAWGFECEAVESLEEALASAESNCPDLVISDYRLRNQSTGADVIASLRNQWDQDLPALLITGDTAPDRLQEARSHGIRLLHKPVSPSDLYRNIVEICE
jgi:signal transduction histidine kinase/CheY-like chemotaxis protein